jgi:hypothetical protein
VTHVGDVQRAFSDAIHAIMPTAGASAFYRDVRDATGRNLEGIGIVPKVLVKNKPTN